MQWSNDSLGVSCVGVSLPSRVFIEQLSFLHLHQKNMCPNIFGTVLDLVLTNCDNLCCEVATNTLLNCDIYHPALECQYNRAENINLLATYEVRFDFRNAKFEVLDVNLLNVDWDAWFYELDVDECVRVFYLFLDDLFNMYVPTRHVNSSQRFPTWFSAELREAIREKSRVHYMFKSTGNFQHYLDFSKLRSECLAASRREYREYVSRIESDLLSGGSPKPFWSHVANMKGNSGIPGSVTYGSHSGNNGDDIATLFSECFASAFVARSGMSTSSADQRGDLTSSLSIPSVVLSLEDIYQVLSTLDANKGAGPDGIPAVAARGCALSLARPRWLIFNKSLDSGTFPSSWKVASVKPLWKAGNRSDVSNYRPISMLCVFSKIFERLVLQQLKPALRQLIHPNQHGFMGGRSTVTNLLVYEDFISRSMESGYEVDGIYTDFSKAFDKVDHDLLMYKLREAGFCGVLLQWFGSYLSDRTQYVKINNYVSSNKCVTSGVPQGSHLSPLLFNLFINDISACFVNSNFLLFADDLKVYHAIRNSSDAVLLQSDLDRLHEWCASNRLPLNLKKCHFITFSRCNRAARSYKLGDGGLVKCETVVDLGVTFNSRLSWHDHVAGVVSRAYKQLGFVNRHTRDFDNLRAINVLYCSLVRSVIEYASVLWSPSAVLLREMVEKVQRRHLRYINFRLGIPIDSLNYDDLQRLLGLTTLKIRRERLDLSFLYNLVNGVTDCPALLQLINFSVPARALRCATTFRVEHCRTDYRAQSPLNRICEAANRGSDIFHLSRIEWLSSIFD